MNVDPLITRSFDSDYKLKNDAKFPNKSLRTIISHSFFIYNKHRDRKKNRTTYNICFSRLMFVLANENF